MITVCMLAVTSGLIDLPRAIVAWPGDPPAKVEFDGTLVPADAAPIVLWPEAYRGELLILEVADHGSFVNQGDTLIRFDTAGIDERIRQATFDVEQGRAKLAGTRQRQAIDQEASAQDLARAQRELEWARRALAGYLEKEKAFKLEQVRLQNQNSQHGIEDQRDELGQLEKMYQEDELVDATEEIVLKRARRQLASTLAWSSLQEQQRAYDVAQTEAIKQERLEFDVAQKEAALDRQRRSGELQRAQAQSDLARAEFDLEKQAAELEKLRQDREKLAVTAPRRGLVLHGDLEAGAGAAMLKRGGRAALHDVIMSVADPDRLKVVAKVPEKSLLAAKDGKAASISIAAVSDFSALGPLDINLLPTSRGEGGENMYRAEVALERKDPRLRPGMKCKVAVATEAAAAASPAGGAP